MTSPDDLIDTILGIGPDDELWQVRRTRPEVLEHVQAAYAALHFPADGQYSTGVTRDERAAVAYRVSAASGAAGLADHYASLISSDQVRAAALTGADVDERVETILDWASLVAESPESSGGSEIDDLKKIGLGDPEIITLAELIGFTAFQARVVTGLTMMGF